MNKKGLFISVEGIDGSGKTTLIKSLEHYFHKQKKQVYITREPGGSKISEDIRSLLLKTYSKTKILPITELLLFLAARYQNYMEVIVPYLDRGFVVIADRFHYSTIAYQGAGRLIGVDRVSESINLFFAIQCHSLN